MSDYQLLPALQTLLREKHVSRAAEAMNLTQSAMSRVLSKLRDQFDDPLLVRQGSEYQLTPRAERLQKDLGKLLPELERLWAPEEFEPAKSTQRIFISGTDMDMVLMAPALQQIHKQAQEMELIIQHNAINSLRSLSKGEIDFAITARDEDSAGLYRQTWLEDDFVVIVDKDSPLSRENLDLDTYLTHKHGVFNVSGPHTDKLRGRVDAALSNLGLQRKISIRLPNFSQIPSVLIGSELIFSVPRTFAKMLAYRYPIKLIPLPFEVELITIYLYWHQRQHQSPVHQWIRNQLLSESHRWVE